MNYKKLTAPELVDWFAIILGGYTMKGRDARMLRLLMDERGISPTQVLYGMTLYRQMVNTKDVPSFCRAWQRWYEQDSVYAEAELARLISGQATPPFVLDYLDLKDPGITDATLSTKFEEARERTEAWADGILSTPTPAKLRGGWVARLGRAEY